MLENLEKFGRANIWKYLEIFGRAHNLPLKPSGKEALCNMHASPAHHSPKVFSSISQSLWG